MVVLSDFLTIEPALAWKNVAKRHDVVAVRLIDPREESLSPSGLVDLVDSELGTKRTVDLGSRKVREAYSLASEARGRNFRRWCASSGVAGLDASTVDEPLSSLIPVLLQPRQAARGASMIACQEEALAESLVPPRPNLGPEPWPDPSRWPGLLGWWGAGLALVFLLMLWRRRRSKGPKVAPEKFPVLTVDPDGSPGQRLIATSDLIRSALMDSFGPAWGSKTTEEIGDDPTLLERFEQSQIDRLVTFLKVADRVKFASAEPDVVDDWEAWASTIVSSLAVGAKSDSTNR